MIIIFNLSGLLVGLAGLMVAFAAALATNSPFFGIAILGATWVTLGRRWGATVEGRKPPYPSIFFIPLRFVGVLLLVMGIPLVVLEKFFSPDQTDERSALLAEDEKALKSARLAGDNDLSAQIAATLSTLPSLKGRNVNVFTRIRAGAVLILVQIPDLAKFMDPQRDEILHTIEEKMKTTQAAARPLYIGLRGPRAYGAIQAPHREVKTGVFLSRLPLFSFYSSPANPATRTTQPTTD